ncbi:MAG TPA: ABC transporter ATP-binding protein [Opitutaceae bacterium]|nr:ABC transporter ATP-binding protein [Opitutaceae bacterium]
MQPDPLTAPTLGNYLWRSRRRMRAGVVFAILRTLAVAPGPLLFQRIIDRDVRNHDIRGVLVMGAIFLGLMGLHWVFSIRGSHLIAKAMAQLMLELRSRIFFRLQYLSFTYLDQQQTGRLLAKYAFDTQKVETLLYSLLNQFVPNMLYSVTVFIVLATLNWELTLALLLILPLWGIAKWRFFTRLEQTNRKARLAQERLTGRANEYISALKLVRSLGEESQAERELERTSGDVARLRVDQYWVSTLFGTFAYVSTQVLALLVVGGGALLAIHGRISLGTLFAFVTALPALLAPVQLIINMSEPWFAGQESYTSIKELIDSPYVEGWNGTHRTERLKGDIQFDRVTFAYPGGAEPVVRDFSLRLEPGRHVALVGPSGAGKSTLTHLLLGLYASSAGEIRLDGMAQRDWDMRWVRRQMAVVMQESVLLSGTIGDNIRFARPEASDEEVRTAARLANAAGFIEQLPEAYATLVGERGATLSGGQRQRLAIARAILRNPPVLILDEATSALDYESERLIQEALERLAHGRTVITIAHRLSTIRNADWIVMLRSGAIVEQGDYATLVAQGGAFASLMSAQNQGAKFIAA